MTCRHRRSHGHEREMGEERGGRHHGDLQHPRTSVTQTRRGCSRGESYHSRGEPTVLDEVIERFCAPYNGQSPIAHRLN